MEELIFIDNKLTYRDFQYLVGNTQDVNDAVFVTLINEDSEFTITLVSNQTTINGFLQTSAQMIIDTLSNGQS